MSKKTLLNKITQWLQRPPAENLQTDDAKVTDNGRVLDDHPSNKISPAKLKTLMEDAENGDIQAQAQLFMDIEEQDSDIGNAIQTRKRAVLTLDWQIKAPRNATAAEEALTAEVDELFHQIGYLDDVVMDCMDAVGHGFAAIEILWQYRGDKWFPAQFLHRPPSWFKLDKHDQPLLLTPGNQNGEPLIPHKWVVHKHKNRSTQLARNGLFRTLAWLYMFKHYSVFDFAEFLELYGFPIRIGKYGAGATEGEKKSLLRALADIGHNAAGIMPDSMNVELHNAANGTSQGNNPYLQMVEWCEKSIARLVLGQTLTSGADGKTSTNALGNVHNEVRRDLLVSDARQLEQTITQQIILPYLLINFPNIDPNRIPQFSFETKEPADIKLFAESLPALVGIGLPIPTQWALDKLGIPQAEEGEPILQVAQAVTNSQKSAKNSEKQTALTAQHGAGCGCADCRGVALSAQLDYQDEIDRLVPTDEALNQQMVPLVQSLVKQIQQGKDYESVMQNILQNYHDIDDEQLQTALTQAFFIADIWGRISEQR